MHRRADASAHRREDASAHCRTVAQTVPQRRTLHSSGTKVRCNVTALSTLSTLSTLSAAQDRLPAFQHFRARAAAHEPASHARIETISRRLVQSCRSMPRLADACAIARTHARTSASADRSFCSQLPTVRLTDSSSSSDCTRTRVGRTRAGAARPARGSGGCMLAFCAPHTRARAHTAHTCARKHARAPARERG